MRAKGTSAFFLFNQRDDDVLGEIIIIARSPTKCMLRQCSFDAV
jgi:hypothetical protein